MRTDIDLLNLKTRHSHKPLAAWLRVGLVTFACLTVLVAHAQWQWMDKDGRRIYSDRPPPAEVPEKSILKRPGRPAMTPAAAQAAAEQSGAADSAATPGAAPSATAKGNTIKLPSVDSDLERKKKATADQEAARRKAEEEKFAAQRAENCTRAQADKKILASGARLARTNASGEREVFDDRIRAEEGARLQNAIDADCK